MIAWFAGVQIAVALVGAVLAIILGLLGRKPSDLTMGPLVLVELLLIVQVVISIVAPLVGNQPSGSLLEYWARLDTQQVPPLKPGDVVTLVAEGIGSMSNTIVAGASPVPLGKARATRERRHRNWAPVVSHGG